MKRQEHFNNFMVEVEQGYGSGTGTGAMNIYHNRRHAADVTQAVHYFLRVNISTVSYTHLTLPTKA